MQPSLVLVADSSRPLEALGPAVSTAAANGCDPIAIDIDGVAEFGIPQVRQLIRLLRIARAGGTSVALRIGSAERRRALYDMGLDQVFPIVA